MAIARSGSSQRVIGTTVWLRCWLYMKKARTEPMATRDGNCEKIPLVNETVRVDKESVVTGVVRVSTETKTVSEIAQAAIEQADVEVTRVPVGHEVAAAPEVRTEGDVTIVPVMEESFVIQKRLFLKEEIHVRRIPVQKQIEVPVTLRKQHVSVERLDAEEQQPGTKPTQQRKL